MGRSHGSRAPRLFLSQAVKEAFQTCQDAWQGEAEEVCHYPRHIEDFSSSGDSPGVSLTSGSFPPASSADVSSSGYGSFCGSPRNNAFEADFAMDAELEEDMVDLSDWTPEQVMDNVV